MCQVPRSPLLLSDLTTNPGVPTTPSSGLIIGWDDSQTSGECFTYSYWFSIEDATHKLPVEEIHRAGIGGRAELPHPEVHHAPSTSVCA